jgi:VWFA-related protein
MGAAAAALATAVVAAQQQDAQPVFRARTDLVSVYVVAVDANDQPVHGLKKEDFTVSDRNKPQAIDVFDEVEHDSTPSTPAFTFPASLRRDVATNNVSLDDRLVVIVADDLHIYKDRADRSKDILRMLVDKLGPKTPMALLFTSGNHSIPVTEDRSLVLNAVDTLKGRRGVRRPAEANDKQMPGMGNIDPTNLDGRRAALATSNSSSLQDFFDNMSYYKTLQDASRMLAADDGRRKTFVVVSEGIGKDLSWLPEMRAPSEYEENPSNTPGFTPKTGYHDYAVLDMMTAMRRSNVATYAIDPRGKVTVDNLMKECSPHMGAFGDSDPCSTGLTHMNSILRQAQQGLEITADVSGGFAVTDSDDFEGGVDRIVSDLDNYYLLGFYPKDTTGKGFRGLMVTVDQPGVLLRFRQGYEVGAPPPAPKTNNPLTALAIGMAPKRDLPLRITASAFPDPNSKMARVATTIEVTTPRRDLEDANGRISDSLKYLLLVADVKNGKPVKQLTNTASVASAPLGESAPAGITYQMPMGVVLPPGRYQLRASASSTKLSRSGSVFLDLEVPDFGKESVTLSGIEVGYADGPRVTQAKPPGAMQIIPFDPSLDREFHANDTVRVFFEVARKSPNTTKTTVELVDYQDHVVTTITPQVNGTNIGQVDMKLPLKDMKPGAYRVRATATSGGTTATREVGIVVR